MTTTALRGAIVVPVLSAALVVVVLAGVALAGGTITWTDTVRSIGTHLGLPVTPLSPLADSVVWQLRLPRVLLAAAAGAGLAVCGCVLQAVTRNVLAEPYLLGISSGASTGAVLVLVLGLGAGSVTLAGGALAGGLLSFALVFALMGRDTASTSRVVLTGVVVGQLFSAVTSLVVTAWGDADATRGITYWLLGSLAAARWSSVAVCAVVVVVATVVFVAVAPALDAFVFGHDAAVALGIDVRLLRIIVLVGAAATTAAVVAAVGAIGFVGLVVPHAARMLVGPGHRLLLPVSALAGGVFLVVADLARRLAFAPHQIPVGVVTALIGVPTFLVVLRRGQRA